MHDSGGITTMIVAGWVLIVIEEKKTVKNPEKNSFSSLRSALNSCSHLGMAETSSDWQKNKDEDVPLVEYMIQILTSKKEQNKNSYTSRQLFTRETKSVDTWHWLICLLLQSWTDEAKTNLTSACFYFLKCWGSAKLKTTDGLQDFVVPKDQPHNNGLHNKTHFISGVHASTKSSRKNHDHLSRK